MQKKQKEIDNINKDRLSTDLSYEMFVKTEKQLYENDNGKPKAPKNRCICAPRPDQKYVLGPVTYQLEKLFAQHVKGYCGGKNWTELEDLYNNASDKGFEVSVQLDGSGFDRTQHYEIKKIVDHYIYKRIAKYVHHVDKNTFLYYATPEWRTIKMIEYEGKGVTATKKTIGTIRQRGKVFSGSMDTGS